MQLGLHALSQPMSVLLLARLQEQSWNSDKVDIQGPGR